MANKGFTTIDEQINILRTRGLTINDEEKKDYHTKHTLSIS